MTTTWQLWVRVDLGVEEDVCLGAIGEHACASLGELMRELAQAEAPTLVDAPLPPPVPCVVAVDAPVLARDPSLARLVPDRAGVLLVAPSACSDDEIDAARAALDARPAWTALCDSGLGGGFGRDDIYQAVQEAIYDCPALVSLSLYHGEALARAGAQHRDALLRFRYTLGTDGRANLGGYTIEQILGWGPDRPQAPWQQVHAHRILSVLGPVTPEFRLLLDALPAGPDGAPFAVEVRSYEDEDPLPSGQTVWEAYRIGWFRRAG